MISLVFLKQSKFNFYLIYITSFLIFAFIFFQIIGFNGLQIANFIFSFIILFELCIKIAESEGLYAHALSMSIRINGSKNE